VITFPTTGAGPKDWVLTDEQIAAWQADYPSLDVQQQCVMALNWVKVNHLKTARGMPRFLIGWLNRAVARGEVRKGPAIVTHQPWKCPHVDRCDNRWACQSATILGRPERQAS
jgi:hypothetical protein